MSHHRPISPRRIAAATAPLAFLLSSCSDLTIPVDESFSLADLIVLSQQENAPAPATVSFWVSNARRSVERVTHPDNFNSLYLELTFPAGCLASLGGSVVAENDSLFVTIAPRAGEYGFTLSPSGLTFNAGTSPTATFSFSVYGDASAGAASSTYGTAADYVDALDIWREIAIDEWDVAPGSGASGIDEVNASIRRAGRYVLAAPT